MVTKGFFAALQKIIISSVGPNLDVQLVIFIPLVKGRSVIKGNLRVLNPFSLVSQQKTIKWAFYKIELRSFSSSSFFSSVKNSQSLTYLHPSISFRKPIWQATMWPFDLKPTLICRWFGMSRSWQPFDK